MDWGNAIIRSKTVGPSGQITAMAMDLHLDGDFRKTKKKITWLSSSTSEHPLIDVTLLDYDYLITKKKLDETDDVADFVTPVSEFKEEAFADTNVKDLAKGDIMQFERKGYFIFDGTAQDGKLEFIQIPDGKAASLASKAGAGKAAAAAAPAGKLPLPILSSTASQLYDLDNLSPIAGGDIPMDTKMYFVEPVYGAATVKPTVETKLYQVSNVYDG
jgi:glutamyl-tRNA synthetase